MNYRLVRERDGLTKESKDIKWLTWNDDRSFKSVVDNVEAGASLLMSPFNNCFTWQTTIVTEIISNEDDGCIFKTENSSYTLTKLKKTK